MVLQYDPKQVAIIIGGKVMSGFADGTFVTIKRAEKAFNLKIGVDGEGTRSKSNNKSGMIEIVLMQSSASNDDLSALTAADELSNLGAVPCLVNDKSGRTLASCLTGWVQKYPDAGFAKEVETRTWIIETDNLALFIGGN
jgi:hypothetical protein